MLKSLLNLITLNYTFIRWFWNNYWFWLKIWHCKLILRNLQRFNLIICLRQRSHPFKIHVSLFSLFSLKTKMSTWVMGTLLKTSLSSLLNPDPLEETVPKIFFFFETNFFLLSCEHRFFINFLLSLKLMF